MRALIRVAVVLACGWLGLVSGTAAAALWLVADASGPAGPAIALGYGLMGGLALVVVGGILAVKLSDWAWRRVAAVVLALTMLSGAALTVRYFERQAERQRRDRPVERMPRPAAPGSP